MNSYTVTNIRGCKVINNPIPIRDFAALMMVWADSQDPSDKWICDSLLSHALGAAFVCGPMSATRAWRKEIGLIENTNGV
jgi:hypothetical protein